MGNRRRRRRVVGMIGMQFGVALLLAGVALFVFAQPAEARRCRTSGDGNCGNFIDAIQQAQSDDLITQMIGTRSTDDAVITKSVTIQGGWIPVVQCDTQNQVFTDTLAMLDAGFVFAAPEQRSELFNTDNPVFTIAPSVHTVTLENLDLNKDPFGNSVAVGAVISGVITNGAHVVLDNVILRESEATQSGGALYLEVRGGSRLEIRNSQFLSNTASNGGGFDIAVYDNSTVLIDNTIIQGNRALAGRGGGGRIVIYNGSVVIRGGSFLNNQAFARGGGLAIVGVGSGVVELLGQSFSGNSAPTAPNVSVEGSGVVVLSRHLFLPTIFRRSLACVTGTLTLPCP